MFVGSLGLQLKRHALTTVISGRRSPRARTEVLFPVPFGPRINTPPIRGLTELRSRARFSSFWPTIAAKG
jgi:hypothetical protein